MNPARPPSPDQAAHLIALDNPSPHRQYEVRCETTELTCVCPVTGQPDFARFTLTYTPQNHIVELKSLKLYLWSFHDRGVHHEAVTNQILDDLVALLAPTNMTVETRWNVRGGITTTVTASHPD